MEMNKNELLSVIAKQDETLDSILKLQNKMHECIVQRKWIELSAVINELNQKSDEFVKYDEIRQQYSDSMKELYSSKEIQKALTNVKSKLIKSKIENQALSQYVKSTQNFISGVIEKCVPQSRNTLYTRTGAIRKPSVSSLLVNTTL